MQMKWLSSLRGGEFGPSGFALKVRNHCAIWSVQESGSDLVKTMEVKNHLEISHADTDQVATAPCTDPIQVRSLLLRQGRTFPDLIQLAEM